MSGDSRSGGHNSRRELALGESYVATIAPVAGGGIFAALVLAVELAVPLLTSLSQNRLPGLPIADAEAITLVPGRFSFTHLRLART